MSIADTLNMTIKYYCKLKDKGFIIASAMVFVIILSAAGSPLFAQKVSVMGGVYGSFMPGMGGNLDSYTQEVRFQSGTGIDGINRDASGFSTSNIDRLTGFFGGVDLSVILNDYFLARLGFEYGTGLIGGTGKTVYDDTGTQSLKCRYNFTQYDIPLTLGLSIPFWHDSRISVSFGTAFANAKYENKFETGAATYKGSFSGWGFPLVVIIQGDYYIRPDVSLTSGIVYFRGRSKVVKDGSTGDGDTDYASIDFTGFRFSMGVAYNFYTR